MNTGNKMISTVILQKDVEIKVVLYYIVLSKQVILSIIYWLCDLENFVELKAPNKLIINQTNNNKLHFGLSHGNIVEGEFPRSTTSHNRYTSGNFLTIEILFIFFFFFFKCWCRGALFQCFSNFYHTGTAQCSRFEPTTEWHSSRAQQPAVTNK